jgi:hypothetical protein
MNRSSFDALTRRASLATLSAAGLAAVARPAVGSAKGDSFKRCKKEADECTTSLAAECQGDPTCPAQVLCCDHLKRCKFGDFVTCLLVANASTGKTALLPRK